MAATGSKGIVGRGDRSKGRLVAGSGASKSLLPVAGKREGMDELIELIEKDTQELQVRRTLCQGILTNLDLCPLFA